MSTTYVYAGETSNGVVVNSGNNLLVLSGGTTSGTSISGTSSYEDVLPGGTAIGTVVSTLGELFVSSGATVSGTILSGLHADQIVYSGGTVTGTVVGSGSENYVDSGGTAIGTVVGNGGLEDLAPAGTFGGTAIGTVVNGGGRQLVESRSTAVDTVISSGGAEIVLSGGTASGTVVGSGGEEIVSSGGVATDSVVHDGGILDVSYLAFTSGGTADLDSGTDILTVTVGGETYTQQLSGSYTGEYFQLTNDGSGGTMITEESTACYCKGTLIRTDHGDVAVENLRIGDRLVTRSGAARPIRWIGLRGYGGRFARGNRDVLRS